MKKWLNILMLTLLLLGQTVLGPIGTVWASELPDAETWQSDVQEPVTTPEINGPTNEEGATTPEYEEPENNQDDTEGTGPTTGIDDSPDNQDDEGSGESTEGEVNDGELVEGEEETTVEEEVVGEEDNTMPSFEEEMPDTEIDSVAFTHNGNPATSPITVKNGDSAEFKFKLKDIQAGHKYGPGTKLVVTLPDIFSGVSVKTGIGDLGTVTNSGNEITVEFNEEIIALGIGVDINDVYFEVSAEFSKTTTGLQETIYLPGNTEIEFTFTPIDGEPITKEEGSPQPQQKNADHIEWTVYVNTDLNPDSNGEFTDTLQTGHKFNPNEPVTIQELTMGPDGIVDEGAAQSVNPNSITETSMTLNLDPRKAYKITYKTYPEDPGNETRVSYKNSASYNGTSSGTKTATITYDAPFKKSVTAGPKSNLETDWEIKLNHNERKLSNITITDTWTTTGGSGKVLQELVGDIKVYDKNNQEVTTGFIINRTTDEQGFSLVFAGTVTEAYTIKYTTKPVAGTFITDDMTVLNTVTRSDNTAIFKDTASVTYNKKSFMLKKEAVSVDYTTNKKMKWKIEANQAGYTLPSNTLFKDRFKPGDNQQLIESTLTVKDSGNNDVSHTVTNSSKTGFDLTVTQPVTGPILIEYETAYEIKDTGTNNRTFRNDVTMENDELKVYSTDGATQTIRGEQGANGKKDGKYNYETKRFEWEVEINFNYNTFTNAIFEDEISNTPPQTIENIVITQGTLDASGNFLPGVSVPLPNKADAPNKILLELGNISTPYLITYDSHVTDDVIPETTGKLTVENNAKLTESGSSVPNATWTKKVGVNYTDQLIKKNGSKIGNTPGIKWNFEFNYAQSNLKNIVITDTVGKDDDENPNQLIKKDSFKVYEVTMSGKSDSNTYNAATISTTEFTDYELNVNVQKGTFELRLPDGDKAYYIEYETVFLGASGTKLENIVEVDYFTTEQKITKDEFFQANFTYGGGGSTIKVPFVVIKTDAATGNPMSDVEFTLYSQFTGNTPLISAKTNSDGVLDLGLQLAQGNYTLKETVPAGYNDPGDISFNLKKADVATTGPYKDKFIVEVENIKTGQNVCTDFTLTVKDVDRNPVSDITLTNNTTGKEYTPPTNNDGEFTLSPYDVKAGTYTVTTVENGNTITLDKNVTIKYDGNCEAQIQPQPAQSCSVFTITIEDKDNIARPNVTVTLKHKTDTTAPEITATTDANGKFTVPSATTQTGAYKVYEGKQYLGDVKITYKEDVPTPCEATVTEAPTCESFTLTVRDVDGKPRGAGVEITIKDKDGNVIETGLTTGADGQLTTTEKLPAGEYDVYEGNSVTPFDEFAVNINCEAEVQPAPACTVFTITAKDENDNIRPNVKVTVKDKAGNSISTSTTDADGNIIVPSKDLPAGKYNVFEGDLFIGEVTVSYTSGCQAVVKGASKCESFTLIVLNSSDQPRKEIDIIVRDVNGNVIITGTTDTEGKLTISNSLIGKGTYNVYEGTSLINSFTVGYSCEAVVKKPSSGGGGGGGTPPTPGTPGNETPGGGTPGIPDNENPKPETPGTDKPDSETPKPGIPGTETPGSETPKPDTPGSETPGSETPKPETPDTEKTQPEIPGTDTDIHEPENPSLGTPGTPDESEIPESPANQSTNVNQVESKDEKKPATLTSGKVLPQTGEGYPIFPLAVGLALISLGLWMLRRKHVTAKQ